MARRAVVYARFSSDNQRDESIDAQIRAAEDYARRNDMQIVEVYKDKAKSATTDKRPDFQRMMEDSEKGLFDVLIVHKLDRFSRDKYDNAYYKRRLRKSGVTVVSVLENLDDSPESIMMESVLEGMAMYYSRNLAREVMKGMRENAYQCKHTGGQPPLGYNVDPKTKQYIIDEGEAEVVRLMFHMYLDGCGYDKIISELNGRGYKTKRGKPFGKNSIHDILANEKYSGTYVFNRAQAKSADGKRNNHGAKHEDEMIRIEGGMPTIIDAETFDRAQKKMQNNKRQPGAYKAKEVYLLSGLIVCGECLERTGREYAMMGNVKYSGRNKIKHVSYRCGNRERTKTCDNKELRREYIEEYVLKELERQIFNDKAVSYLVKKLNEYQDTLCSESESEMARLKKTLADVEKQISNIVDAVANGHGASLLNKLSELEEEKTKVETAMLKIKSRHSRTLITEEGLKGLFSMFREFVAERNIPEIKKFIGNYVEKVIVYKDHVEVVFFLLYGELQEANTYRFTRGISRRELLGKYKYTA